MILAIRIKYIQKVSKGIRQEMDFFWCLFSHGPMARGGYHPAQENEEVDETAGEPIGLGDGHGLISPSAAL